MKNLRFQIFEGPAQYLNRLHYTALQQQLRQIKLFSQTLWRQHSSPIKMDEMMQLSVCVGILLHNKNKSNKQTPYQIFPKNCQIY